MNVLITGAASGIGFKTGIDMANLGYHVYLTTENEKQLEVLKEKTNGQINLECFKLDVTNKKDREKVKNLDIDIFISNSAVGLGGSILEADMNKVRECYEVNVFSNFELTKTILNNMLNKDSGKIIIMSSMISNISLPFFGIYASTKASISMLTNCLRKEIKMLTDNVKIVLIEPGIYKTGFNKVMIDNKIDSSTSLFLPYKKDILDDENLLLGIIGRKKLDSISKKIIKAVEDKYPKKIYRAPFFQNLFIKFYIKYLKK